MGKWTFRLVLIGLVAGGGGWAWRHYTADGAVVIRQTAVVSGPLVLAVTATGHLAPTTEVLVGCEVSGTVEEVLVDHNDRVSKGQVITRLKPESYEAEHAQAKAEQARLLAEVVQLEVRQREAKRIFDRVTQLRQEKAAPEDEYQKQAAAYDAAQAALKAGQAAAIGADSLVKLTQYRLDRTVITSPIDGMVLDKQVAIGQTVAATLRTPTLFVLAEDLSRMELLADISEADIGYVRAGQRATFVVNAYRDRTFEGRVRQVRNQPRTVGNVVTYTVVIDVDNRDRLLRPGMPADVNLEIVRRDDVMKIANAALRFRPPLGPDEIRNRLEKLTWPDPPEPIQAGSDVGDLHAQASEGGFVPPPIPAEKATLWRLRDGEFVPIPIWTPFTDHSETAIVTDDRVRTGSEFVLEVQGSARSKSTLQKAILLMRSENRKF